MDSKRKNEKGRWKLLGGLALAILLGAGLVYHEHMEHTARRQAEEELQALTNTIEQLQAEEQADAKEPEEDTQAKEPEEATEAEDPKKEGQQEESQQEEGQGKEKQEAEPERIKKTKKGVYTPYDSEAHWKEMSTEEKKAAVRERIPIRQDADRTIDRICTNQKDTRVCYSWILCQTLATWCKEQGIEATEGFYLGYGEYLAQDQESFYVELNDEKKTVLLVTAQYQGRYWGFEKADKSKKEIQEQEQLEEWNDEAAPRKENREAGK